MGDGDMFGGIMGLGIGLIGLKIIGDAVSDNHHHHHDDEDEDHRVRRRRKNGKSKGVKMPQIAANIKMPKTAVKKLKVK